MRCRRYDGRNEREDTGRNCCGVRWLSGMSYGANNRINSKANVNIEEEVLPVCCGRLEWGEIRFSRWLGRVNKLAGRNGKRNKTYGSVSQTFNNLNASISVNHKFIPSLNGPFNHKLDNFQRFRFGSDAKKSKRHKKKHQRNSDKTLDLKKLTEKLKQPEQSNKNDPPKRAASAPPVETSNASSSPLDSVTSQEDSSDILKGVNLNLLKPESRTIVGSYYQRTIPFRSASFSRVHYSPDDKKYTRNNFSRKIGANKKSQCEIADETISGKFTLTSDECSIPENQIGPDVEVEGKKSDFRDTILKFVKLDRKLVKTKSMDDAGKDVILEEVENPPKENEIPEPFNNVPQPPKRLKHKHRPKGKFFSEENLSIPEVPESPKRRNSDNHTITNFELISNSDETDLTTEKLKKEVEEEAKEVEEEIKKANNHNWRSKIEMFVTSCSNDTVDVGPNDDIGKGPINDGYSTYTEPSSPEETLKINWPHEGKEEEDYNRRHGKLTRCESISEGESDHGDKGSISPVREKEGRLSPSTYSVYDYYDSDSKHGRGVQSPIPYTKRPLRGPYLEMIVNEKKKPDKISGINDNNECDDCHLRRSNTSPTSNFGKLLDCSGPKRKSSSTLPFSSASSLQSMQDEKIISHQRTTSSPSQLECYSDRMVQNHLPVPSEQFLHQLLRGSSERSLIQESGNSLQYSCTSYRDTRSHIVVELYDTERSYVESLQTLVTKYLQPLLSDEYDGLIDKHVVHDIFFQIPEILSYHEIFLEELRLRLEDWNRSKCIGDIFLETFTKVIVIESYTAFINHWKTARDAIKSSCQARPAFARFLETNAREHKGKLALDSLLIMPVQRIPRYELLIQSLIKHTEFCHPDYERLMRAQKQVHELAVRINCSERESEQLEQIENLIDGLSNLASGDRSFIRHDLVTLTSGQGQSRKERALFLFSDLLVITSIKRRSSTLKKPSLCLPGSIASTLEANKYKFLMKIPLGHLDIVKANDENVRRMMREMEHLSTDVTTLTQMSHLVTMLHCSHSHLEEAIRDLISTLNKQVTDRHISESQLSHLELALNTRDSVQNISVTFSKPDVRASWEEAFVEAKARTVLAGDSKQYPEFLTSVPIRKTRAGLQFTCASSAYNQRDVWVCNSDGYVGQVCVLRLQPEPSVTSCNGVCNSRILCVTSIPAPQLPISKYQSEDSAISSNFSDPSDVSSNCIEPAPDIHLDSSSSSDDEDEESKDRKYTKESIEDSDGVDPTMWLGTEDGFVYIYNCVDNLRVKRNKVKIQLTSSVYCIMYYEKCVYVSLANGDVRVYSCDSGNGWNTTDSVRISVGGAAAPVSKMLVVCNQLWCVCHNYVKILNVSTLQIDNMFVIKTEQDDNRAITCATVSGLGVWFSVQNSPTLTLIHALTLQVLIQFSLAPAVTNMLASSDDIIRQHKAACLRLTSLLACKDLLWIGTSAGVVLTMHLPVIKQNTTKFSTIPHVTGLPHGHTGHVRFLTAVSLISGKTLTKNADTNVGKMLVISGGDGYEDFRSCNVSEIAGREDSTNHLLLWKI